MSYVIKLHKLPAGFAAESFHGPGEIGIWISGLFTPENGEVFYTILDNFAATYLGPYLNNPPKPLSTVECVLVIVKPNKDAEVYVNEFSILSHMQLKIEKIKKGEGIRYNEIADIDDIKFFTQENKEISVADNEGLYCLIRIGWKQAFFFDLRPFAGEKRDIPVGRILAKCWAILSYDEIFKLTNKQYETLFQLGWFPFITIIGSPFKNLSEAITQGKDTKSAIDNIIKYINDEKLDGIYLRLGKNIFWHDEIKFIEAGIERYKEKDYISSVSIVWPRIEGLIRKLRPDKKQKVKQKDLPALIEGHVVEKKPFTNLYLHGRFSQYLDAVYLRDFDETAKEIDVSRHSVAHGVATLDNFNQQKALIGILIIDQLGYYTIP